MGGPRVPALSARAGIPFDDPFPAIDALIEQMKSIREQVPVP